MEATKWVPKVGDRVVWESGEGPEMNATVTKVEPYEGRQAWFVSVESPSGSKREALHPPTAGHFSVRPALPENAGLRPAPAFAGPHGSVTLRAMADIEPGQMVSFGGAVEYVALPKPAPVEPRGFKAGDRIKLNAKGLAAWAEHMGRKWAQTVRDGTVVVGVSPDLITYTGFYGVHPDHVEHVPSAPVYSPPPPSGPVKPGDKVRMRSNGAIRTVLCAGPGLYGNQGAHFDKTEPGCLWAALDQFDRIEPEAHSEIERIIAWDGKTRCPRCRQPGVELITSIACLAAECVEWREPEPTVTSKPRQGPNGRITGERTWKAEGHGVTATGPSEALAIAAWRAKVEQGGRR